jgi:hypothetical protein
VILEFVAMQARIALIGIGCAWMLIGYGEREGGREVGLFIAFFDWICLRGCLRLVWCSGLFILWRLCQFLVGL